MYKNKIKKIFIIFLFLLASYLINAFIDWDWGWVRNMGSELGLRLRIIISIVLSLSLRYIFFSDESE